MVVTHTCLLTRGAVTHTGALCNAVHKVIETLRGCEQEYIMNTVSHTDLLVSQHIWYTQQVN